MSVIPQMDTERWRRFLLDRLRRLGLDRVFDMAGPKWTPEQEINGVVYPSGYAIHLLLKQRNESETIISLGFIEDQDWERNRNNDEAAKRLWEVTFDNAIKSEYEEHLRRAGR